MRTVERVSLWIILLSLAAWGVVLLIYPDFVFVTLHGADSVSPAYSRYSGAWFIGVAAAAGAALGARMSGKPVFLVSLVGATLSFVVLLIDLLGNNLPGTNDWIFWVAIANAALLAVLSYVSLREPA